MAKNSEKYQVICTRVGLLRDSWALDRFIKDAVDHHMDDQPGKLVALRLTEYYELLERLNVFPGGLAVLSPFPGIERVQSQMDGNVPTTGPRSAKAVEEDDDEGEQSSIAVTNTGDSIDDDVLDQWG